MKGREAVFMFMLEYKDIGWWYWLATAIFLTMGVSGYAPGFQWAISLSVFQLFHYVSLQRSVSSFPVQVRFWYLMLLLVSWFESMHWLFWVPTIGTWAQIIFGYCTMARLVSLFPWNRVERFSMMMLKRTFLSAPKKGSVKQGFAPE